MTPQIPSSRGTVLMPEPAAHDGESRSAASLLSFFALAFAWSWACWLLAPAIQVNASNQSFVWDAYVIPQLR